MHKFKNNTHWRWLDKPNTAIGKTTGFVIPNLLTWEGSAVVLDVKGENFEATARHRRKQGDKIFRFAPTDFEDRRTHRYNPLLRISELKDPAQQQMELQLLASLFLQNENERVLRISNFNLCSFALLGGVSVLACLRGQCCARRPFIVRWFHTPLTRC